MNAKETLAKDMMLRIMQDNGAVNRLEKVSYPAKHVRYIGNAAEKFFDLHPNLLNDDVLDDMCTGSEEDCREKYSDLEGFSELYKSLNNYFNQGL